MTFIVLRLYNSSFKKYIQFDEKKNKVYSVSQTFYVGNPLGHDILLARSNLLQERAGRLIDFTVLVIGFEAQFCSLAEVV